MVWMLVAVCFCMFGMNAVAEESFREIWDIQAGYEVPEVTWLDQESPVRSLTFPGPEFQGHATEVFAFYATPGSIAGKPELDKDLPAVVCLHGGGGTAFAEWVNLWARRGYAAIALDFSGRRVPVPEFDPQTRELIVQRNHRSIQRIRLEHGGPEQGHVEKFENVGETKTDDWQYHAITNIMRAHSLIRSFPEVDENRTAVTGISWGGYLTCLTASVDSRFKAAVPVYGCGFLFEGESVQKRLIDGLSTEKRKLWIKMYDPSSHLVHCHVPILFVNGTNDVHYPLDSYMKSFHAVPGEKNLRIEVQMSHSHPAGWAPSEIEAFIASKIRGEKGLARIELPEIKGESVVAQVQSPVKLKQAEFHWTTDSGILSKRTWQTIPASIEDQNRIVAQKPVDGTTIWFVSATDERGEMTSSEVIFVE